jgi:hypothetical protein
VEYRPCLHVQSSACYQGLLVGYVVGRWEGGGTHTGPAFNDFLIGGLPTNTGRKMKFTGTSVLELQNGLIIEEIGHDDDVTALTQLGLIKKAA